MPSGKSRRRSERQLMNRVASYVRKAIERYNHARSCELFSEARQSALEQAENSWATAGSIICNMENPYRAWRLVGRALENKLPTNIGWRDANILAAYSAVPGLFRKPFRRIKAKFVEMFPNDTLPSDYSYRRSLKRLGCLNVAGASGRPRKKPAPKP